MSDELENLERLARAATPGPWVAKPRFVGSRECDCEIVGNEDLSKHIKKPEEPRDIGHDIKRAIAELS